MATFLGRDAELGALERALADVSGGRGRLFLLVGEPGIGKTRLADELAARAPKQLRVLWGRCWEAGGAPAYWPWIEVLRPLLAEMDPRALLAELGPAATSLAALIPELGERLPELGKQVDDSDHARFRLFDALARFLRLVAARTPLLLVLDDLHVADRPSLLLLDFVARTLRGTRAMIVGTYRDADARLRPEVDDLLAQIAREGERLELRRLRESEIAELIEGATETAADPRTVAAVVRATEGTPLYVSEVVRLIAAQRHWAGSRSPTGCGPPFEATSRASPTKRAPCCASRRSWDASSAPTCCATSPPWICSASELQGAKAARRWRPSWPRLNGPAW
jgi:predicted ATPase